MAHSSGMGLRRGEGLPFRMTKAEKKELKRRADSVGLSMVEYARCKTFDIPFDVVGGKPPRRPKTPAATQTAAVA